MTNSQVSEYLATVERGEYQPVTNSIDAAVVPRMKRRDLIMGGLVLAFLVVIALVAWCANSSRVHGSRSAEVKRIAGVAALEEVSTHENKNGGVAKQPWDRSLINAMSATIGKGVVSELIPPEHRHDGNKCEDTEEEVGGLCYKKCDLLSNGRYPVRCTPFSCGLGHPCLPDNQHAPSLIPGTGYNVNGHDGLPHPAGACLLNEELFLGECYKKCEILTNGTYPHRTGSATCCKDEGFKCWDFVDGEDWTSSKFDVGGGKGDNDTSTPAHAHRPLQKLTEGSHTVRKAVDTTALEHLEPKEHLNDHNKCEDNEENNGGLCYKKCGELTNGEYPIRTSAFSCCKSRPCGVFNEKTDAFEPCSGFDVNGHDGCPHAPGGCLINEELWGGVCYKQCKKLTHNKYPFRSSPVTCCKTEHLLSCLDPIFSDEEKTSDLFIVGGGSGDHDASTPGLAHRPLVAVTESV